MRQKSFRETLRICGKLVKSSEVSLASRQPKLHDNSSSNFICSFTYCFWASPVLLHEPRKDSKSGLPVDFQGELPASQGPSRSFPGSDTQVIISRTKTNVPLYGASSTDALVTQLQQATTKVPATIESGPSTLSNGETGHQLYTGSTERGVEILHDQNFDAFVLPQRQAADGFLSCYWEFLHPVFPILHKSSFLVRYESIWAPADPAKAANDLDDTIFQATLNLVFALGCQFSSIVAPGKRAKPAHEFYQRSRKVVNFEIFDAMQLSLVQMLLLTGVYLQSTECGTRCWNVVGLAIRVAQGLGLHFNDVMANQDSQSESEIRRRVWYSCVLLDRLATVVF